MLGPAGSTLSRRERQIMEIVVRLGRASVADVMARLTGDPAYSTVRAQLRVLEQKGHLRHEEQNLRYVYLPTLARDRAGRPALASVIETFFDGSTEKAVAALLDISKTELSGEQLDRLSQLIDQARMEGR